MGRSHQISDWDPEDSVAWEAGNKFIARRNLIWSVAAEHVGFSVWSLWSVMVLFMPTSVYGFSAGDKFLLGATATLVGACLRFPYTFATAKFGGRNWTIFSALVLLIPTVGSILLLANPGLPLWPYLVCGALAGLGGGNFAASMTNINAFFPQRLKGAALALNAGGGNLGVPMVQLVGLLVIATAGDREPYWVCAIDLVRLAVAGLGGVLYMDNLADVRHGLDHMASGRCQPPHVGDLVHRHFRLVHRVLFRIRSGAADQLHRQRSEHGAGSSLHAAQIAFLGPLLGSLSRIYGGKLADRIGGGRVTLAAFCAMPLATGILISASTFGDHLAGPMPTATMVGYVIGFTALFILSGIGNGSRYKMIPSIFEARSHSLQISEGRAQAVVAVDVRRADRPGRGGRRARRSGRQPGSARVLPDQWHGHRHFGPSGCSNGRLGADLGDLCASGLKERRRARAGDHLHLRAWPTSSATPEATEVGIGVPGNPAAIAW
ncbi:nitrate/nitrite transporter [Mycobacterium tuberculosis]